MRYEMSSSISNNHFKTNNMHIPYRTLNYSLALIEEAIKQERIDELFYDYLIKIAPNEEAKDIIVTIRDDEKKHNIFFREIYEFYKGEKLPSFIDVNFEKPASYVQGIRDAMFDELNAVEIYRDIRAGIPDRFFRDMVLEIITDELRHSQIYNYLLSLYLHQQLINNYNNDNFSPRSVSITSRETSFSEKDASLVAKVLGIDFKNRRFDLEQFRMGLDIELEHGKNYSLTNITDNDSIKTGKIALAHLLEIPDYYTRLAKMEEDATKYWSSVPE